MDSNRLLASGCYEGEPHHGVMHLHTFTILENSASILEPGGMKHRHLGMVEEDHRRGRSGTIYAE